jgi:hypothetical protein
MCEKHVQSRRKVLLFMSLALCLQNIRIDAEPHSYIENQGLKGWLVQCLPPPAEVSSLLPVAPLAQPDDGISRLTQSVISKLQSAKSYGHVGAERRPPRASKVAGR